MKTKNSTGYFATLFTIAIWGTTFVSTKILLRDFLPIEILFFRFLLGFIALTLVYPRRLKVTEKKQEIYFILAGLSGVCLYYLLENIALTYTQVSNVSVIVSVAPFFTALLTKLLMKNEEKLRINFFIGFLIAMAGICLISFQGQDLQVHPFGDLLSILAALAWACYSVITRKISSFGYNTIQTTRRVFAYGIVFMLPELFLFDSAWNLIRFTNPIYLFNMIFLGLGASALCFVTWNFAVKVLGAVKTSVYIYMTPVITVTTSVIVLHEKITLASAVGIALTLIGVVISERKFEKKEVFAKKFDSVKKVW